MTSEVGILNFGTYLPKKRLQRSAIYATNEWFAPGLGRLAVGERAIANWDEDAITMAVEAARGALDGIERNVVRSLSLASTTLPFADRLNAGVVKEALNFSDNVGAFDLSGGQRAATSGLIQSLEAVRSSGLPHLAAASEIRVSRPASEDEMMQGDGAASILIGTSDVLVKFIGSHSTTIDFVDHFRSSGERFDYRWESRWVRDEGFLRLARSALGQALKELNATPESISHFLVSITAPGVAEQLAKDLGISPEAVADRLTRDVGDTGVAHPFLLLSSAIERARKGERILLLSFGQGVDVLLFESTGLSRRSGSRPAIVRGVADSNYARWLSHRGHLELERGMRSESDEKQPGTTLWRNRRAVLGLVGGRCKQTGTVQFPLTDISVDPDKPLASSQEQYPLADRAAWVVSFTADLLAYSPSPPAIFGLIDFDGGGRLMAEFTDCSAGEIEVGAAVKMAFRIKSIDQARSFTKYFWKAVPLDSARN